MFVCMVCHEKMKGEKIWHDFKDSWGKCEICGHVTGCADCRCHHLNIR